jgi:hypothetical protein
MPNNRVLYACQGVAIAKTGHGATSAGTSFDVMHGVQSVGITSNFTLEQVFEYGQIELYSNVEDISEVEVTIEKVIDGHKLLYLQAVGNVGKTNLLAATNSVCDVYLGIYPDTATSIDDATANDVVYCSGMQVSAISYNYSVDGNATESLTLVGSNKFWNAVTAGLVTAPTTLFNSGGISADPFDGTDAPLSGIQRRGDFNVLGSVLPAEVTSQAHNFGGSGIQSISVSADFGREDQTELGRFGVYNRTATPPFEVTCSFEVTATRGDLVSFSGVAPRAGDTNRTIILRDRAGTVIDLGTRNKLTSVTQQGGDTGGGNMTITYEYSTFNDLRVNGGGADANYW